MFDPAERHSVRSADGARILLVLAPWPAEGHYVDGGAAAASRATASRCASAPSGTRSGP
jgi:hypothetical protein